MFKATVIAGAGGFIGTCMRFLSEKLGAYLLPGAFPLGTFMANILGCLLNRYILRLGYKKAMVHRKV